ncbi:hypothetical protein [Rubeoparvulum massiliense]|uniref:hypothetical protein n=1 Tax=Rubeoparvulum massiliense TaxID=1631346 RepID=UPI00065DFD0B|nr:hypothetical protein [Rubeoparvulum massiliense]
MSYEELEQHLRKAKLHLEKGLQMSGELGKRGKVQQERVAASWQKVLSELLQTVKQVEKQHQVNFMSWINWWKLRK